MRNATKFWVSFQAWYPKKREEQADKHGNSFPGVKCRNGMKTENFWTLSLFWCVSVLSLTFSFTGDGDYPYSWAVAPRLWWEVLWKLRCECEVEKNARNIRETQFKARSLKRSGKRIDRKTREIPNASHPIARKIEKCLLPILKVM